MSVPGPQLLVSPPRVTCTCLHHTHSGLHTSSRAPRRPAPPPKLSTLHSHVIISHHVEGHVWVRVCNTSVVGSSSGRGPVCFLLYFKFTSLDTSSSRARGKITSNKRQQDTTRARPALQLGACVLECPAPLDQPARVARRRDLNRRLLLEAAAGHARARLATRGHAAQRAAATADRLPVLDAHLSEECPPS